MAVVTGVAGISKLVTDNFNKWGLSAHLQPALAGQEIASYVNKSEIESKLGVLNSEGGNEFVVGTWQMDYRNTWPQNEGNLIDKLEKGTYSSIPKEVQQKMAAEYKQIRASNGGDERKTLQDQTACLIATIALQAENEDALKAKHGYDIPKLLQQKPELAFTVRYTMHQLPPEDVEKVIGALIKGDMNVPINSLVSPANISSNPSTYRGVETLGDFVKNLDSKKVMQAAPVTATAAAAGVTLPSNESILAVISDLRANGQAEAADQLNNVVQQYAANQNNQGEVSTAMNKLQQHIKELYDKNGVQFDDATNFMAMHLGPFSAAVALKADPNAKVSEAKVVIDGKETKITKESYDAFKAELQQKGIQLAAYEEATIAQLRTATIELYQKQKTEAQTLATQAQNGEENKRVDYFQQMTQQMMQQNPILGMIMMVFSFMVNSNNSNETSLQPETVQQTAPAPAPANPTQSQSPVGDITLPMPQTPVSPAVDAGANGVLPPAPQNLPPVVRTATNEITPG